MKKGSTHSDSAREKMKLIRKGVHNSPSTEFKKGSKINLGHRHTKETRIKIGLSQIGRIPWNKGKQMLNIRGENHPRWKGGKYETYRKSEESKIEYKLWHDAVLARDNYTCQKYLKRGGELEVHHILNFSTFPELRLAIDNGITLSKKAHQEFHKKYGRNNNTLEQLLEFIKKI